VCLTYQVDFSQQLTAQKGPVVLFSLDCDLVTKIS
jgi:hypothetical protein